MSVLYCTGGTLTPRTDISKRHGSSTLFAAPDISPGTATAMTCRRKRRFEFQDFSDILCKPIPDMCCPNSELEVHLTLDNCIIRYGLDKRLDRNTNA